MCTSGSYLKIYGGSKMNKRNNLLNKKEENIKIKIVIPILEELGYELSSMTF